MNTTTTISTGDCELDLAIDFNAREAEPDVGIMADGVEIDSVQVLAGRVHVHDSTDCFLVQLSDEQCRSLGDWLTDRCNGNGCLADKIQ